MLLCSRFRLLFASWILYTLRRVILAMYELQYKMWTFLGDNQYKIRCNAM